MRALTFATLAAGLLAAATACGSRPGEQITQLAQPLSANGARILGFESSSDWTPSAGVKSSSTQHSQGTRSLGLRNFSYSEVKSAAFDSLGQVGNSVSLDLLLPTNQPNSTWYGTVGLKLDVPSKGLFGVSLGQQDLTGTPLNVFKRFTFALSPTLRDKLRTTYTDARFTVVLNVPMGSGTYLLDRLDTSGSTLLSTQCVPGGRCMVTVHVPRGLSAQDARFVAEAGMTLGDRTHIDSDNGQPGTIANDSGLLKLGYDAQSGNVFALGPVTLRDRARVQGSLSAPAPPTLGAGATITGEIVENPELTPLTTLSYSVNPPSSPAAGVDLQPNTTGSLAPGGYSNVAVKAGATLNLQAGNYFVTSLALETASTVKLNQATGRVNIYVLSSLAARGKFITTNGAAPNLLLVYFGTSDVSLEAPFTGTAIAPYAKLSLGLASPNQPSFTGAYFAKQLVTGPDTRVILQPSAIGAIATTSLDDCAKSIVSDPSLPEPLRSRQAQLDLLKFCLAPGIGECEAQMMAIANADRHALALKFLSRTIDAPEHLAVTRDITRKVHRMQRDPTLLAKYCQGDSDGDRVPEPDDTCSGTPPLTETDDRGCPKTSNPKTAPRGIIEAILSRQGILYNPKCDTAVTPDIPIPFQCRTTPGHTLLSVEKSLPSADLAPEGCELWYELQVYVRHTQHTYNFAFEVHEATRVVSLDSMVVMRLDTSDADDRGRFAEELSAARELSSGSGDPLGGLVIKARATNGNGVQSQWSGSVAVSCGF